MTPHHHERTRLVAKLDDGTVTPADLHKAARMIEALAAELERRG